MFALAPAVALAAALQAPAAPPAPATPTADAGVYPPAPRPPGSEQKVARDLLAELVGIDTSHETGGTTAAAEAVARHLRKAGFPAADVRVLGSSPRKKNLVARLRGTGGRKPLLLLGHLDVVQALREDWSMPPYQLTEKDGYFYGRGTLDMKGQCAIWIASLLRLKREAIRLDRDIILALTADEERVTTEENGVRWLLANQLPLVQAELALNEGGSGEIKNGRRRSNDVQASEKGYLDLRLEVRNKGGHSSLPDRDNAIVRLSEGLARLGRSEFPARLDPVTHLYLERLSGIESGPLAADMRRLAATAGGPPERSALERLSADPYYNARLRTTCVPTRLEGGHANNALPQLAAALVNCRLLPGDTQEMVVGAVTRTLADENIKVKALSPLDAGPVGAPPADFLAVVDKVSAAHFPGVAVLPVMTSGATDGRFLRAAGIPTYGVSGLFHDVDDIRAHGRDERILVQSFFEAQEFLYDLIKALAGAAAELK
jgi:acetylornithine deacetylase/succinyl-diaminopimelate desuccinylase-like protein